MTWKELKIHSLGRSEPVIDRHPAVIEDLTNALKGVPSWKNYLDRLRDPNQISFSIHLAVFVEPFLRYILNGKKTIESRFSSIRCAPYGQVKNGDVVLLKKVGGPVVGICSVQTVWSYRLEDDSWGEIKGFAREICADEPSFWQSREGASFATLMRIQNVHKLEPFKFQKRDRRGWVVLHNSTLQRVLMD